MASKVLAVLACATAVAVRLPPSGSGWRSPVALGLCLGVTWVLTLQALLLRRLLAPEGSAAPSYEYAAARAAERKQKGEEGARDGAAGDAAAPAGGAGREADFRGWLWLAAASQASLKPRLPEAQGCARRFVQLRGATLCLCTSDAAAGGDAPVELDLRGCEVFCAPGARGQRRHRRCAWPR